MELNDDHTSEALNTKHQGVVTHPGVKPRFAITIHMVLFNGSQSLLEVGSCLPTSPPNEPFSLPGDSGTLIFNHSCRVLGMVIGVAEMGGLTFITHIDDLFEDIKATTGAAMVRVPGYKRSS